MKPLKLEMTELGPNSSSPNFRLASGKSSILSVLVVFKQGNDTPMHEESIKYLGGGGTVFPRK